jgi:uroporphyrinogen-III decarboxylase
MRHGSPQQVENQVKAAIDADSSGGGFILGPGCTLYQDTPLENMNAVGRTIEKYGRSPR